MAAPDPILERTFTRTLEAARARVLHGLLAVRLGAGIVWLALVLFLGMRLGKPGWRAELSLAGMYLALGALAQLASMARPRFDTVLRYSIVVVELPIFFRAQVAAMHAHPEQGASAMFGMALFLGCLFIAALMLGRALVVLTALLGFVFQLLLLRAGDLDMLEYAPGVLLLMGGSTAAALIGIARTVEIVRAVASEQVAQALLGRHFSPEVARRLAREGAASGERDVTMLVCDIRGFTRLAQGQPASQVAGILDDYLTTMVQVIFRNGGTVDNVLGDGILACFGAPFDQPDHARRAVYCAIDMLDALDRLNDTRAARGELTLRIGIGVHSGRVLVGSIGPAERREYMLLGEPVRVAAEVEAMGRELGTALLVSASTRAQTGAEFFWRPLGMIPRVGEPALEVFGPTR